MNLECISIPLGAGTPGGSAPLSTGLPVVEGGGTRETESALNRLGTDIARRRFHMWKNQGHKGKSNKAFPDIEIEETGSDTNAPVVTEQDISAEARELISFLAQTEKPGESVAACLRRASKLSGLPYSRITRIHYDKPKTIVHARELEQLKRRASVERAVRIKRYEAELDRLKRLEGLVREPA